MKSIYMTMIGLAMSVGVSAQTLVEEKFDGSVKLDWQEYADKEASALTQNGYFEIKSLNKDLAASTRVELPVDTDFDFTVKCTVLLPNLGKTDSFGIFFDMNDNFDKTLMLFSESKVECVKFNNGRVLPEGDSQRIKFQGGRNCRVDLELKRRGRKFTVLLNNMKVYELTREKMLSPLFGFYTTGVMRIESFVVEQDISYE